MIAKYNHDNIRDEWVGKAARAAREAIRGREDWIASEDDWIACIVPAALAAVADDIRAEAWDEGHEDGQHNEHEHRPGRKITNPYREGSHD